MTPRRPRTRSLAGLYDLGAQSARDGAACPYEPPRAAGDDLRAYFWWNGHDDEALTKTISSLV